MQRDLTWRCEQCRETSARPTPKPICLLALLGLFTLFAPIFAQGEDAAGQHEEEVENLEGEWTVVEWEIEGGTTPSARYEGKKVSIKDNAIRFMIDLFLSDRFSFQLNSKRAPKEIEITALNGLLKGTTQRGIYEVDGRRLRICMGVKVRPTEFVTTPDSGLVMVTLEKDLTAAPGSMGETRGDHKGQEDARRDIERGTLKYKRYGQPSGTDTLLAQVLKADYGITLDIVAACDVEDDVRLSADQYNEVILAHMTKKGQKDFLAAAETKAREQWNGMSPEERSRLSGIQQAASRDTKVGTLTGRFVFDGEPPDAVDLFPELSKIDAELPHIGPERGGEGLYRLFLDQGIRPNTEDQSLLVNKDKGIANVVIWVVSTDIPWTAPADLEKRVRTITFKDGNFTPRVAVAVTGQPILVENHDPVGTHIRVNPSRVRNNAINRLLKPNSDDTPLRFTWSEAEATPAKYESNLGPWATGSLLFCANSFVAVSQTDGSFTMPDLPSGEWEFQVWHERQGFIRQWPQGRFKRTVKTGDYDLGDIRIKPQFLSRR